ncbi:MAG: HAD-IIA family hydrolase [Arachnia propionica]|uniref:HAD-IIA family hydrolase n=1 Tax=Arachnia propionica TaxID=1750 RepID=UPI0026FD5ECC|nr:HAD-IIA family hydrolase [Arachnia propionica]
MNALVHAHDAALFDLDGVIYLGPHAIDGVPRMLSAIRDEGVRLGYVTNNAARTPGAVAAHLRELGIDASTDDVVNSTQATVRMLQERLPAGAHVLAVGTDALVEQLAEGGFTPVDTLEAEPVAVVQGYHPQLPWALLELGIIAIERGAQWFATNPDQTRPTERGILPGCGAQIDLITSCVGFRPEMAGKPFRPLLDETVRRLDARHPIFVGDRIDTDIVGAGNAEMDSLFVFTGAHGKRDLLVAPPVGRPTHIGHDIGALLAPPRVLQPIGDGYRCGAAEVTVIGAETRASTVPTDREGQLDLLWAALHAAWHRDADIEALLDDLDLLR